MRCHILSMRFLLHPLFLFSPLEDDEGHEADNDSCQDGAVDGDEFII